jgi:transcriptional regulator with XRE-family HTH domain
MKGKKKAQKLPGLYRLIVAVNVAALMKIHFSESRNRPVALSKATGAQGQGGLSKSTVQRVLTGEIGVNLETLEAIAEALQVMPYQLLIPALDAGNPQIVKGATEAEKRLYRSWKHGHETGKFAAFTGENT